MANNPNPRPPATPPAPLQMTQSIFPGVMKTSNPDKLATWLGLQGWARCKPRRREMYRLRRGDNWIAITHTGGCVGIGPAAIVALHLAAEVQQ